MKARSDRKPKKVVIDVIGEVANVSLSSNVEVEETENGTEYIYDYHTIKVVNQDDLENVISQNFDNWLLKAKAIEAIANNKINYSDRIQAIEDALNFLLGL